MERPTHFRFDLTVTCGFALVALAEAFLTTPEHDPLAFTAPSAVALALPLLVRRHHPVLALAGVLGVVVLQRLVLGEIWDAGSSLAVPMCAVYSASAYLTRWPGLAATAATIVVTSVADVGDDGSDWPFLTLIFGAMWVAGMAARRYRRLAEQTAAYAAELESLQAEREEAAARAERTRIARELHDVVAHCVSTMVVQAEAGHALIEADRRGASESFVAIQDTGRQALVELRRLLGLLRDASRDDTGSPQPRLAQLTALLDDVRRTGLDVTLSVQGMPRDLSQGVDLSAYRIVQESLTNTVKHARARHASVTLRYGEADLEIEVLDDGTAVPVSASASEANGHGLVGMAERAHLLGGTLEAGRTGAAGYAVHARLPLQ